MTSYQSSLLKPFSERSSQHSVRYGKECSLPLSEPKGHRDATSALAIVCLQAWKLKSAGARLNQLPFEINSIEGRMSGAEFFAALKSQAPTAENILVAAGMKKT